MTSVLDTPFGDKNTSKHTFFNHSPLEKHGKLIPELWLDYPKTGYFIYTTMVYLSQERFRRLRIMEFRLKELRKKKNISQLKLAIDLNLNQNTISRYENMEREADYETLIKIADYFNVSLDYLLGRSFHEKR